MGYTNVIWEFLRFWFFCQFSELGKSQNWQFSEKKSIFWLSRHQKWVKNSKSRKIPNSVCVTHEMGPLCQKRGFKSDLEPKWKHFWDKKVLIFAHFPGFFHTFSSKSARRCQLWRVTAWQRNKLFWICKKFLKKRIWNFQNHLKPHFRPRPPPYTLNTVEGFHVIVCGCILSHQVSTVITAPGDDASWVMLLYTFINLLVFRHQSTIYC